jgi:hypothetical protein
MEINIVTLEIFCILELERQICTLEQKFNMTLKMIPEKIPEMSPSVNILFNQKNNMFSDHKLCPKGVELLFALMVPGI